MHVLEERIARKGVIVGSIVGAILSARNICRYLDIAIIVRIDDINRVDIKRVILIVEIPL
jgi:hypothetical protein